MQRVERFMTKDGREFKTIDEAQKHEQIVLRCEKIMAPLGEPPKLADGRFKQHPQEVFLAARKGLVLLASELCKQPRWKHDAALIHQHSIIGRYLDDAHSEVYNFWSRIMCFDNDGREFSQPFYAAKSIQTNRRTKKI